MEGVHYLPLIAEELEQLSKPFVMPPFSELELDRSNFDRYRVLSFSDGVHSFHLPLSALPEALREGFSLDQASIFLLRENIVLLRVAESGQSQPFALILDLHHPKNCAISAAICSDREEELALIDQAHIEAVEARPRFKDGYQDSTFMLPYVWSPELIVHRSADEDEAAYVTRLEGMIHPAELHELVQALPEALKATLSHPGVSFASLMFFCSYFSLNKEGQIQIIQAHGNLNSQDLRVAFVNTFSLCREGWEPANSILRASESDATEAFFLRDSELLSTQLAILSPDLERVLERLNIVPDLSDEWPSVMQDMRRYFDRSVFAAFISQKRLDLLNLTQSEPYDLEAILWKGIGHAFSQDSLKNGSIQSRVGNEVVPAVELARASRLCEDFTRFQRLSEGSLDSEVPASLGFSMIIRFMILWCLFRQGATRHAA